MPERHTGTQKYALNWIQYPTQKLQHMDSGEMELRTIETWTIETTL